MKKMCGIVWCCTGSTEQTNEMLEPARRYGQPALELVGPMPFPALNSMFDALYPPGFQWYWKADFMRELSDEAIGLHLEHGSRMPTMFSTMHLYPVNGAGRQTQQSGDAVELLRCSVEFRDCRRRSRSD